MTAIKGAEGPPALDGVLGAMAAPLATELGRKALGEEARTGLLGSVELFMAELSRTC